MHFHLTGVAFRNPPPPPPLPAAASPTGVSRAVERKQFRRGGMPPRAGVLIVARRPRTEFRRRERRLRLLPDTFDFAVTLSANKSHPCYACRSVRMHSRLRVARINKIARRKHRNRESGRVGISGRARIKKPAAVSRFRMPRAQSEMISLRDGAAGADVNQREIRFNDDSP